MWILIDLYILRKIKIRRVFQADRVSRFRREVFCNKKSFFKTLTIPVVVFFLLVAVLLDFSDGSNSGISTDSISADFINLDLRFLDKSSLRFSQSTSIFSAAAASVSSSLPSLLLLCKEDVNVTAAKRSVLSVWAVVSLKLESEMGDAAGEARQSGGESMLQRVKESKTVGKLKSSSTAMDLDWNEKWEIREKKLEIGENIWDLGFGN